MYWEMFINNAICECPVDRARFQKRFVHTQTSYVTRVYIRKSIRIRGGEGENQIFCVAYEWSGTIHKSCSGSKVVV